MLHPTERPVQEAVAAKIDPLSPERNPEPCTIDLHERQTGVSFRRLFGPYLRGARAITLIDPYLREASLNKSSFPKQFELRDLGSYKNWIF